MGYSVSMRNQGRGTIAQSSGSLNHNKRENVKGNPDLNLNIQNIELENRDLQELYQEQFDESVQKYNAKQTRNDRKIENYLEHIDKSSKTNVSQEFLVAIGDKYQNEPDVLERKINTLKEFYVSWKNDNHERLKVFHASIHLDEANPHLHINYVAVGHENKRGLEVQVSSKKAFRELGFDDYESWRHDQLDKLTEIMKEHGLEYEFKNSKKRTYLEVPEYKAMKQDLDLKLEQDKKLDLTLYEKETKIILLENKEENLSNQISNLETEFETRFKDMYENTKQPSRIEVLSTGKKSLMDRTETVTITKKDFEYLQTRDNEAFDNRNIAVSERNKVNRLESEVRRLKPKLREKLHGVSLESRIKDLERENKQLKSMMNKIHSFAKEFIKRFSPDLEKKFDSMFQNKFLDKSRSREMER